MNKLFLFMMVSLDGFVEGEDHDLSWHNVDNEFNTFAAGQLQEAGSIVFGRKTYELMEGFWPQYVPEDEDNTIVRNQMDTLPKYVFSRTLAAVHETPEWQHITLFNDVNADIMNGIKEKTSKDIIVLGSSDLSVQLLENNLLNEIRIMVNPVLVGSGKRLFDGLETRLKLSLQKTRSFSNGNELLTYSILS